MLEIIKILTGILVLILGFPTGNFLAKHTKDELKQGQFWFKIIIIFSVAGALVSLVFRNDVLLFTFAFIAIVTSRSLRR